MQLRGMAAWILTLLFPALVYAESWTSRDGFLSVTPPDTSQFQEAPLLPPHILAQWASADKSTEFTITRTPMQHESKLTQASVEAAFATQLDARVVRLPTKIRSGYEVWCMKTENQSTEIMQAIIPGDKFFYRLQIVNVGGNADPASAEQFLNSLAILQPAGDQPRPTAAPESGPASESEETRGLGRLARSIVGACVLLGVAIMVYLIMCNRKRCLDRQ